MSNSEPGDSFGSGVLLTKTWSDTEAEMIRSLLGARDIPCQVVSDVPHSVWPLSVDGLGEVRIVVPESRLAEARELLAAHTSPVPDDPSGEDESEEDEAS